jgi:hypothetical protein
VWGGLGKDWQPVTGPTLCLSSLVPSLEGKLLGMELGRKTEVGREAGRRKG